MTWVQVVLGASGLLVAVVAGAGAAWKIWKAIDKVEDAWAVLSDIAEQFKPNGGQSLYDRITSLEHRVKQIQSDLEPFFTDGRSQT